MGFRVLELSRETGFSPAAVRRVVYLYGALHAADILHALKSPGGRYFLRVNTLKTAQEEVIKLFKEYGVKAYKYGLVDDAVYLRIRGPFRISRRAEVVVADKAAAESVYVGADLYAPGVLKAKGVKEGDKVTVISPRGHAVAEGVALMDGDEMTRLDRGMVVKTLRSVYRVPGIRELDVYKRGLVYPQSLPSILAVHALSPKPGWRVIDMCAAPGGKATHAAQLMNNEGEVVAVDRSQRRISAIEENVRRLGLTIVKTAVADSRYLDLDENFRDADAVILDPPCTSLGVRPSLYYERREKDFRSLKSYQRQFVRVASKIVKRGGMVLYTTCTLSLEENEFNVWLSANLGLSPLPHKPFVASPGFAVGSAGTELCQRFDPAAHDTPGFFIALLRKPR